MIVGWKDCQLGDVITLQRGFDLPIQDRKLGNVSIVGAFGTTGTDSEAKVAGGGVVSGRYGTIGEVFYIKQDFWPLNTTLFVKGFKGNDPLFISYLLHTIDFESHNDKSSVPGVKRNHLHMVKVSVPRASEQRIIANIVGSLDEKIEVNRQMNETLEAIARALFKSWFVDFDPVRAKMEGREPDGMDTETAALFPGSIENSTLGKIPKGWRVGKISELTSVSRDGLNPNKYPNEIFEHYSLPAFDEGALPRTEAGIQIMSNKYIVTPDSVLLSKMNPRIPRVWLPMVNDKYRSVCSTEFIVNKPKEGCTREYLYSLFCSDHFLDIFASLVTGTTGSHQRVTPYSMLSMDVVVPSKELIVRFTDIVRPIYEKQSQNLVESGTLASIRNLLLPKLMSGEIRAKEAEKYVESHL